MPGTKQASAHQRTCNGKIGPNLTGQLWDELGGLRPGWYLVGTDLILPPPASLLGSPVWFPGPHFADVLWVQPPLAHLSSLSCLQVG